MDKRIAMALKVLVFNPVRLDIEEQLLQVEDDIVHMNGLTLTDEQADTVSGLLNSQARSESALKRVTAAMDACDEVPE